ncbi:Cytochrome P450 [Melia azedarach]|uniref:Cytochrome P450 n=1 Tax=Melia azedarach TaxID=155640 RepID=A0ACC1XU76_MELAZ|nr:Cytochrome P450 [Melia azedarach]
MADNYGPIFTIRLGFLHKTTIAASELLGYNYAIFGFAPYGPYWREMHKITTVELLSNYRLDMFKPLLHVHQNSTFCTRTTSAHISHVTFRMVAGRRFFGNHDDGQGEKARQSLKFIRDFFDLFGVFVLSDAIPSLGWLDIGGYKKAMKRTAKGLDALVGGWL